MELGGAVVIATWVAWWLGAYLAGVVTGGCLAYVGYAYWLSE